MKRRALSPDQWASVSKSAKSDKSEATTEPDNSTVGKTEKFSRCPDCSAILKETDFSAGECQHCGARISKSAKSDSGVIDSGTLSNGGKANPAHFPGDRKKIPAETHGVMIAHMIPAKTAKALSVDGGEPCDGMHVTLAYLGKGLSSGQVEAVRQALKQYASQSEAYTAKIGGGAVFSPSESSEGRRVQCALVDSGDVHDFRSNLIKAIESTGVKVAKDHGFTPHITMKYLEKGDPSPSFDNFPEVPLVFDEVSLCNGDNRESFKLSKSMWSAKYINDLPDKAFLVIDGGGEKDEDGKTAPRSLRHFPVMDADGHVDLPHLRNALSRIPQSNLSQEAKDGATKKAQAMLDKAEGERVSKAKLNIDPIMDIAEGESGTGIFQTHEMGMLRQQIELTPQPFGWSAFVPDEFQVQRMQQLLGVESAIALAKAIGGYNGDLVRLIDDKVGAANNEAGSVFAELPEPDQKLLMALRPVDVHVDIRLVRGEDKYWQGGELLFPGNQYGSNKLMESAGAYQKLDLRVDSMCNSSDDGMKCCAPIGCDSQRMRAEFPTGGVRKGDMGWMTFGLDAPAVISPNGVGANSDGWARCSIRSSFKWTAGKQSDTEKEFWLEAGALSGLWILRNVRLAMFDYTVDWDNEDRVWIWERAYSQKPKSEVLEAMLNAGAISVNKSMYCPVVKADDEKRLIWGVVLEPETVDGQGDVYSAEVIEKAAHDFLANYNRSTQIGYQHNSFPAGLALVESWCAPTSFKMGSKSIKKGTWMMVTHIENDDVWAKVKDGKVRGYSIAGVARVKQLQPGQ